MTFVLALTGSIGMGKSTTADMFAAEGIPVWDADETVHRLYGPSGGAADALGHVVPDAVVDDRVDRDRLRAAIEARPELLEAVEKVVHPLVAADRRAFLAAHADAPLVVLDIPLLFETGGDVAADGVLVVTVDPKVQADRVLARPGMTPELFRDLLSRQVPDAEKRARADFVIETDRLDRTRAAVHKLIGDLVKGTGGTIHA